MLPQNTAAGNSQGRLGSDFAFMARQKRITRWRINGWRCKSWEMGNKGWFLTAKLRAH